MDPRPRRKRFVPLAASSALGLAVVLSRPAAAGPPPPELTIRAPESVRATHDPTTLGRTTGAVRLVLHNTGAQPIALADVVLRFVASRDGVTLACEGRIKEEVRLGRTLRPRDSITEERTLTCDTPLPGAYEITVLGRTGDAATDERELARFTLHVEEGASKPVRVPWSPKLWALATSTRDARPGTGHSSGVTVAVALANGTAKEVREGAQNVVVHVVRLEGNTRKVACNDVVGRAFAGGTIGPWGLVQASLPIACDFRIEATYELQIALLAPDGTRLPITTVPMRIAALPTPLPPAAGGNVMWR